MLEDAIKRANERGYMVTLIQQPSEWYARLCLPLVIVAPSAYATTPAEAIDAALAAVEVSARMAERYYRVRDGRVETKVEYVGWRTATPAERAELIRAIWPEGAEAVEIHQRWWYSPPSEPPCSMQELIRLCDAALAALKGESRNADA